MSVNKAAIFDLDGTLVDTLPGIAFALRQALGELGVTPDPAFIVRAHIGGGSGNMLAAAARHHGIGDTAALSHRYHALYQTHCLHDTVCYAGVKELVVALKAQGVRLAVLTNKDDTLSNRILQALFLPDTFEQVYGARPDRPLKPDISGLQQVMAALGTTSEQCLYVGDTSIDVQTANRAGVCVAYVTWGYGDADNLADWQPNAVCHDVVQLTTCLRQHLARQESVSSR
ncbi:Phosphoglycolate phosphatase [Dickeya dianthicola]|uniref:phosphoglycolate phosphatase n=1 Tax=Dickeya dianthicola TaxID=204039 RepID=A0AAP2GCE0_9GAMM|nr:HAD family hydrolase [Dickeya dianthicola]ATO31989.1 Phosphoglycolate phosphatase [Dickeya dianthicola RNS04.9]AYC18002.1 Phosphoglycolate phosphatase [Dickeya dianthicola]MBI0439792.1 HAD family hydrolase [Dickeya dianthicola]MBI0450477.1 HAD family hydrolase [Dickeya dianthicola]MBI0455043.1 HAD family hydrolase [Dickeya dianthicola]